MAASIRKRERRCIRLCSRCKRYGSWKDWNVIADAVLQAAEAICQAGAHWDDLHLLCHRVLCEEFITLGIFKGTVDEMLDSGISQAFFPHGLGKMLSRQRQADG
jgi:Xaa-Pro aminopeptidase